MESPTWGNAGPRTRCGHHQASWNLSMHMEPRCTWLDYVSCGILQQQPSSTPSRPAETKEHAADNCSACTAHRYWTATLSLPRDKLFFFQRPASIRLQTVVSDFFPTAMRTGSTHIGVRCQRSSHAVALPHTPATSYHTTLHDMKSKTRSTEIGIYCMVGLATTPPREHQ